MFGCAGLDYFGGLVEENKKDSNGVRQLYNDLKFFSSEVIHDVMVQLSNSNWISIHSRNNIAYMQPLYEMGDCPVFKVPDDLGDTSKIM